MHTSSPGKVDGVPPGVLSLGSFGWADPCWEALPIAESVLLFLMASNLFPDSAAKEWANSASPPPREVAGSVTAGVGRVVVKVVGVT